MAFSHYEFEYSWLRFVSCMRRLKQDQDDPEMNEIFHWTIHNCLYVMAMSVLGFLNNAPIGIMVYRYVS